MGSTAAAAAVAVAAVGWSESIAAVDDSAFVYYSFVAAAAGLRTDTAIYY